MQQQSRDVMRYAVVLGGFFLAFAITITLLDPAKNLAYVEAEHVRLTLTCIATLAFAVLSWGLMHLRGDVPSARAQAFRNSQRED